MTAPKPSASAPEKISPAMASMVEWIETVAGTASHSSKMSADAIERSGLAALAALAAEHEQQRIDDGTAPHAITVIVEQNNKLKAALRRIVEAFDRAIGLGNTTLSIDAAIEAARELI